MTETILSLVPTYGLPFLFGIAVLAASGVPVSSSLALLVTGAFIASGELGLTESYLTALAGAVIGDQIGYQIGLRAGNAVEERLSRKPKRAAQLMRAKEFIGRFGGVGVFLTRWLLAPIGPITNVICGASDMRWLRFTIWDFAGEVLWVAIYIGAGYAFRGNLEEIAALMGEASWLLIAALAALGMGIRVLVVLRQHRNENKKA
ncbi:MAG: DedA family protein [Rhodobacteraceae bacterium]|nr:DedA family protein [Paracoccaceae bacterium]